MLGSFNFLFLQGNFAFSMPGSNVDSVSKDSFLLVQFKKFPNPSSKSNDKIYNFHALLSGVLGYVAVISIKWN